MARSLDSSNDDRWTPRRVSTAWCCWALLAAAAALSACTSRDIHEIRSTIQTPMSVTLIETYSQQVLWSYDIPVEHTLVMDFDRFDEYEWFKVNPEHPATHLKWRVVKSEGFWHYDVKTDEGQMKLPGSPVMFKISVRPAPEYPPGMRPGAAPVPETPQPLPAATAPVNLTPPEPPLEPEPTLAPVETAPAPAQPAATTEPAPASGGAPATPAAETAPATQPEKIPLPDL